jgi:TetR/AcrR family fatty acid metabolism transcriptional regulator
LAVRSGDKRAVILDAAQAVIARQGYHSAQIAKIAAEAGVAAGTVYLYFKNKPDLLVCLFRERLGGLVSEARNSLAVVDDPAEKVGRFIWHHLHALATHRELARVTQIEMRQADTAVQQQISQIMQGYFTVIDEIIEEGHRSGRFRRDLDRRQIRNLIFGTLDQTVTAWVMSGFRFDLEALAGPTRELVLCGVTTRAQGGMVRDGDSGTAQANI